MPAPPERRSRPAGAPSAFARTSLPAGRDGPGDAGLEPLQQLAAEMHYPPQQIAERMQSVGDSGFHPTSLLRRCDLVGSPVASALLGSVSGHVRRLMLVRRGKSERGTRPPSVDPCERPLTAA